MVTRGNVLTVAHWAYAAGIVDGEGCITIKRTKAIGTYRRPRYIANVSVVNSNIHMIEWLHENFGGSFFARKKQRDFHKNTWAWDASALVAAKFCEGILPYLLAKREQAEIVLDLMNGPRIQAVSVSDTEFARREGLVQRIRVLNRKGDPQRLNEATPDASDGGEMRQSDLTGNRERRQESKLAAPVYDSNSKQGVGHW